MVFTELYDMKQHRKLVYRVTKAKSNFYAVNTAGNKLANFVYECRRSSLDIAPEVSGDKAEQSL